MIWEYYVSVAWQVQTLGFWLLTLTPPMYQEETKVRHPPPLSGADPGLQAPHPHPTYVPGEDQSEPPTQPFCQATET